MPRWNLGQFLIEDQGTESLFSMVRDYPGGLRIRFEVESTGDLPSFLPRDAVVRLVCHEFLERLPSEALGDVWANIYEAWEWHTRPALPDPVMQGSTFVLDRIFDPVEEKPFRLTED